MRFHLPVRPARKPLCLALRVLLTPPAAIADGAADAVMIVLTPVAFACLIVNPPDWRGGHTRW